MYIIHIIYIIYIMYIIYNIYNVYNIYNIYNIYNVYNLFISLVWRFKKSSSTDRRMYVTTLLLFVICYLL